MTMATKGKPTVSAEWLQMEAARLEMNAEQSLPTWIVLGQTHRYCEDMGLARALREAAQIKNIGTRRTFLRALGIDA
jgi:hypothetical protein